MKSKILSRFKVLCEDNYDEALQILQDNLSLINMQNTDDLKTLKAELSEFELKPIVKKRRIKRSLWTFQNHLNLVKPF